VCSSIRSPSQFCTTPKTAGNTGYRWDGVHFYKPGAALEFRVITPQLLAIPAATARPLAAETARAARPLWTSPTAFETSSSTRSALMAIAAADPSPAAVMTCARGFDTLPATHKRREHSCGR